MVHQTPDHLLRLFSPRLSHEASALTDGVERRSIEPRHQVYLCATVVCSVPNTLLQPFDQRIHIPCQNLLLLLQRFRAECMCHIPPHPRMIRILRKQQTIGQPANPVIEPHVLVHVRPPLAMAIDVLEDVRIVEDETGAPRADEGA